ncbi:MAG: general secretion pathway protein GspK [Prosthecobacter sp.]|uniref:general secretion pathway protein GspK n=1 Tax=Prosthecobacter sp. TaxID=1965333 RepID=UPI001A0CE560|nr:type II secretion system protein GspK [Prosthecobacter sp.]MBE2286846.1 general secretion pathway protein GspK [Prosthecobacter sp.]
MIWAVLLMSVTVMGVVEYIRSSARESLQAAYQFKALHLAESGLAVGLHPNTRRGDVVLKQKIGPDSGFDVVINYEGARIPINYATDERLREAIYNLFIYWQLNADQAAIAADSLADWVDNDNTPRANGAEADYYQQLGIYDAPRNQGFIRVDEMLLVRGMDAVDRHKPEWREYFSVYGEGQIDLRTVFKDVLLAVTGASENDVARFISERDGADGIPATEDDRRIRDEEAYQLLGLSGDRLASIRGIVNDDDTTLRRITSIGWVGDKRSKIIVVTRRNTETGAVTYLGRMEE